jgi:hypothetical protein
VTKNEKEAAIAKGKKIVDAALEKKVNTHASNALAQKAVAQAAPTPSQTDIKRVVALAERLVALQKIQQRAEEALTEAKKDVLAVERDELPSLMEEVGVTELKLATGQKVSVVQDCDAKIPEAMKPKAFAWLLKNGFGGIIKTQVLLAFGKGQHDDAAALAKELQQKYPDNPAELDEGVHPSTLKAFVKERMTKGEPVPTDLFGVFFYKKAVVKD